MDLLNYLPDNVTPTITDTYEEDIKRYEFGDSQPSLFDSPTENDDD